MTASFAPTFGQLLRHHRLRAGLSQERLAELAGLSVNQISDMERDRRARPHPDTLRRLVAVFGLGDREREAFITLARPGRQPQLPPATAPMPVSLTSFIAPLDSLAAVRARLARTRLLTLTGVGGVGKTRLAMELARSVAQDYPDGVLLSVLAWLKEHELLSQSFERALGLS